MFVLDIVAAVVVVGDVADRKPLNDNILALEKLRNDLFLKGNKLESQQMLRDVKCSRFCVILNEGKTFLVSTVFTEIFQPTVSLSRSLSCVGGVLVVA